jgi:hypothetical protein
MVGRLAYIRRYKSLDKLLSLGFNGKVVEKEAILANLCNVGDRKFHYMQ